MTELKQLQEVCRQLKEVLAIPDLPDGEAKKIRAIQRKKLIRLALMIHQKDLERSINGDFDPTISRKLDALEVLLTD